MDKFSYAIGLGIGQNLWSMGARNIDVNDFAQAIKDVLEGNQTAITHNEAREIVNKYFTELEEKARKQVFHRTGRKGECGKHSQRKSFLGRKQEESEYCNPPQRTSIRGNQGRKRKTTESNRPRALPLRGNVD